MKFPTAPEEVEDDWIEHYLTKYEKRRNPNSEIKVTNIRRKGKIEDATDEGDSYQGDVFKLEVTAMVENNEVSRDVEYHHIIKFTTQDAIQKEFNKVFTNPKRELLFLSEILANLNDLQAKRSSNKFPIHMPEYVYIEKNNEGLVLVIENMKNEGYVRKSKTELLDFNEAKIALEQLARLHSISYVYYKRKKNNKEKSKELAKEMEEKNKQKDIFSVENTSNWFISNQEHFIDIALDFLNNHKEHIEEVEKIKEKRSNNPQEDRTTTKTKKVQQNKYKDLIEKITYSKSHIIEKNQNAFGKKKSLKQKILCQSHNAKRQNIFCLNHGAPWNNNILVRNQSKSEISEQSKSEISVYFTDWENVHWNTPAYDLNYFVAGALTPELRLVHLDELLKHYHDHFTEVTKALCKNKTFWTSENFRKEFDAVSFWGFLKSLRFSMTLSEAGKDIKTENKKTGTNCCTNNIMLNKIDECIGGVMVKVMNGFVLDKFTYKILKNNTEPVLEQLYAEIPNNANDKLYERFLANIIEGDLRGFFELPPEETKSNDDSKKDDNQENGTGNVEKEDNAAIEET